MSETDAFPNHPQRYEYPVLEVTGVLHHSDTMETRMNELAADGWQLVEQVMIASETYSFVFERPLSAAESQPDITETETDE